MNRLKYHIDFSSAVLHYDNTMSCPGHNPVMGCQSQHPRLQDTTFITKTAAATSPLVVPMPTKGPLLSMLKTALTITLTDLEDDATYYFAVTAYDASGNESTYSNIVSNDTSADTTTASTESNVPVLIFPENNKTDEPVITSFEWDEMDSSYNVRYELVYGTDLDKVTAAGHIPSLPTNPIVPASPLLLLALVSIGLLYRNKTSQKAVRWILLSLLSITLISACGGGGGSSSSSTSKSVSSTTDEAILVITDTGDNPYCDVGPLEYSTTYYWKVVAFDKSDSTVFYESEIYQFTTVSD